MTIYCRGIRGATTVERDTAEDILEATREMLEEIIQRNEVALDDVASAFFTTTTDLTAEFPAVAARQLGWSQVAMLCGHEMSRPGALRKCLRVLVHVNTPRAATEIEHVYLRGATVLRPDLVARHTPPSADYARSVQGTSGGASA